MIFAGLWVLFLAAGVVTAMVGAWRAGFWTERGIPKGCEPRSAVLVASGLFTVAQVFLIIDGALHGNVGQSIAAAVSFLLPVAAVLCVFRVSRKRESR